MSADNNRCVLLFVKYPAPGSVKTRLAKQIGSKAASVLYKSFITDILIMLDKLAVNLKIIFTPANAEKYFIQWLGRDYCFETQQGVVLGDRMKRAFCRAFEQGFDSVALIGSDSPDLPQEYIKLAFSALKTNDAVLGPSSDGGYYLIAFDKDAFLSEVFDNISWSSELVFQQSVNTLREHSLKLFSLPQWYDIDNSQDLNDLIERNVHSSFNLSKTFSSIKKNLRLNCRQKKDVRL